MTETKQCQNISFTTSQPIRVEASEDGGGCDFKNIMFLSIFHSQKKVFVFPKHFICERQHVTWLIQSNAGLVPWIDETLTINLAGVKAYPDLPTSWNF
jgi:hypothetical protein